VGGWRRRVWLVRSAPLSTAAERVGGEGGGGVSFLFFLLGEGGGLEGRRRRPAGGGKRGARPPAGPGQRLGRPTHPPAGPIETRAGPYGRGQGMPVGVSPPSAPRRKKKGRPLRSRQFFSSGAPAPLARAPGSTRPPTRSPRTQAHTITHTSHETCLGGERRVWGLACGTREGGVRGGRDSTPHARAPRLFTRTHTHTRTHAHTRALG
jgi:hypothetical protein